MSKKVLVIKLGTAVITNREGNVDNNIIKKVTDEVARLCDAYNIVIVSSGAVGSGKKFLKDYKGTLSERKAAAAVGKGTSSAGMPHAHNSAVVMAPARVNARSATAYASAMGDR